MSDIHDPRVSAFAAAREEPTLGDALAAAGYGHRPAKIEGKREVYRLDGGEIAGTFDAFEAWQFLSSKECDCCGKTKPDVTTVFVPHVGDTSACTECRNSDY